MLHHPRFGTEPGTGNKNITNGPLVFQQAMLFACGKPADYVNLALIGYANSMIKKPFLMDREDNNHYKAIYAYPYIALLVSSSSRRTYTCNATTQTFM